MQDVHSFCGATIAQREAKIEQLRSTLKAIAGGSFPNATTFAVEGNWQAMYGALQKLAVDALTS